MGMPNRSQQKTAVNINSKALANVFKMEFRFLRKKLVIIPIAALLIMISRTVGRNTAARAVGSNASCRLPCTRRTQALHKMESTYMNTF
jgi:hypothetical protein